MYTRNAELLPLVGTTFNFEVAVLRRTRKKNWIILKNSKKKSLPFFFLYLLNVCWHLSNWQISVESVRKIVILVCSLMVLMTVCCIKNFSQYDNNLCFYWAIINWNCIWGIDLNSGVNCDLRNKIACLNTLLAYYILADRNVYNRMKNFWKSVVY